MQGFKGGRTNIFFAFPVHLLLSYRRLVEVRCYQDDSLVICLLGLCKLPDVYTISWSLSTIERESVGKRNKLFWLLVIERLKREQLPRLNIDFDGSVLSHKGHAEDMEVDFNKRKKRGRSYYPLYCNVVQVAQFYDVNLCSGNVHDSNDASNLTMGCFEKSHQELKYAAFGFRIDSVLLSKGICQFSTGIFVDAKRDARLDIISARRLGLNQVFTLSTMMANNRSHKKQMLANPLVFRRQRTPPTRWSLRELLAEQVIIQIWISSPL